MADAGAGADGERHAEPHRLPRRPINSTNTLALLIYQDIFNNSDFGMGAATAVLLLLLVVVISTGASVLLRRRERAL
jgi:ABC-type sugar transport system permease subunit